MLSAAHLLSALGFAAAISARLPLGSWIFPRQGGHRLPATLLLFHFDQAWAQGRLHLLVIAARAWQRERSRQRPHSGVAGPRYHLEQTPGAFPGPGVCRF